MRQSVPLPSSPKPPNPKWLAQSFNLTEELWLKIFEYQKGLCGVCKQPLIRLNKKGTGLVPINTDHRHRDGKILGLLCFNCNSVLRERLTIEFLRAALAYLENPPATAALGRPHFGQSGRVGTKKQRKLYKKLQKAAARNED